jgi:hypothetical protein
MAHAPVSRHSRRLVLVLGITLGALTLVSLLFDLRTTEYEYRQLAAQVARSFYDAINAMREWNLDHDGFYLAQAGDITPNPYLPEAVRTITTVDGRKLDMVNHAQMTRLLSELLTQDKGIHLHISSLRPLRPSNRADEWERGALARFAAGDAEAYEILGNADRAVFRYMAPLRMTASCLPCHPGESASLGLAHGGVSVSFSYAPFLRLAVRQRRQILLAHGLLAIVGFGILFLMGTRLHRSVVALEDSMARIKRLEGLLPVCANCRKVRLEGADHYKPESWVQMEKYIADRTDADFTHTICPDCARNLYPNLPVRPDNANG